MWSSLSWTQNPDSITTSHHFPFSKQSYFWFADSWWAWFTMSKGVVLPLPRSCSAGIKVLASRRPRLAVRTVAVLRTPWNHSFSQYLLGHSLFLVWYIPSSSIIWVFPTSGHRWVSWWQRHPKVIMLSLNPSYPSLYHFSQELVFLHGSVVPWILWGNLLRGERATVALVMIHCRYCSLVDKLIVTWFFCLPSMQCQELSPGIC